MARRLNILIVDDDVDNGQSLGELLELEGHTATVVHSGEAAINAFTRCDFDIAFMDVMMPGKNGVESFLEIKKLKPCAHVYMMTGYSVEQLLQQAIDNGAMGVLSKPVDARKVLAALKDARPSGIVLIAEDDPDFGPGLKEIVADSGYRAELVQNGRDAIDTVRRGGIEVLILDLKMPLIDGIEVYATLRKEGRAVPTIIITGSAHEYHDTLEAIRDVTLTGILNKPFDPLALLQRLDALAA
jgi:CheY-like chemotaxis protein